MEAQGVFGNGEMAYQYYPASLTSRLPEDLAAENERLRAELEQSIARQTEVMRLLNTKTPDRITHDLRNLINELNLYRSLVENDA